MARDEARVSVYGRWKEVDTLSRWRDGQGRGVAHYLVQYNHHNTALLDDPQARDLIRILSELG